jgi:hypothetical protein
MDHALVSVISPGSLIAPRPSVAPRMSLALLARQHAEFAIGVLREIAEHGESKAARVAAAKCCTPNWRPRDSRPRKTSSPR